MVPRLFESKSRPVAEQTSPKSEALALSVVIPISERIERIDELHLRLKECLATIEKTCEIIYVVDGPRAGLLETLQELRNRDAAVKVLLLSRWYGEATALAVGLDHARSDTILTLPSYPQVDLAELPRLIETFERGDFDLAIARRHPRIDSWFNRLQSRVFHWITGVLTGTHYHDVSCGVRIMRKSVADDVDLYGDLHRFFPLLAYQKGFRVAELAARQNPDDARRRVHRPGVYLRRLLDIVTLFFIFKFTKKPLRFFGLVGSGVFGAGSVILLYLGGYRLLQFGPIANRPLLILGALLIVLGLQLFSIGLLGEIVIFTNAGGAKEYRVQDVRERTGERRDAE